MTYAPKSVVVVAGTPEWGTTLPNPLLRAHVSSYWSVRFDGPRHTVRSLPDGCTDIAFDVLRGLAFVTGPQPTAQTFEVEGASHLFGIRVLPGASTRVLGRAVGDEAQWVPLETWWGDEATRIAREIAAIPDFSARCAAMDRLLLQRLGGVADARVDRAIRCIFDSDGTARVGDVAKVAGASERTLTRLFGDLVGTSPKRFSRMVRFQCLLRQIQGEPDWTAYATDAGYADQAHMIREFKVLFGCTPSEALTLRSRLR